MNIIIPMAGMGKRMRPHTLTIPKPLIPVAGKPIVQRLVEDIIKVCGEKVEEIAFIIGDFGAETEKQLIAIAESLGAKGRIYYQDEPLGTAHAIMCAADSIKDKTVVAFADTLFKADFTIDTKREGIIWVSKIEDPRQFGVVKLNEQGVITDFVEKPQHYVSDLAIIGIYYFGDGAYLKRELQYLLDNKITEKGEYQLTNALENMKAKGTLFVPETVTEWLDCGNKDATVYTNQRVLELKKSSEQLVAKSAKLVNSVIVEPCFIGDDVVLENSVVGPHVSIGKGTKVVNSVLKNSIIQEKSEVSNTVISNSMLGSHVKYAESEKNLSIGDYNQMLF